MPLDKQQVKTLLSFVADTREDEITCDECLAGMAEFAETQPSAPRFPTRRSTSRRTSRSAQSAPKSTKSFLRS